MGDRLEDGVERTADLLGSPPGVDPIAMEQSRARAESKLFGGSAPPKIGRYEIIGTIGCGGMGMVYRAHDPQLQRNVALKILHPQRSHDPRAQQRMILEARALAKLDHPNVVKVHDAMIEVQQVIVVMELLEGETLESWQAAPSRSCREITAVYAQAGDGLAAAHRLGVVHRDFKPSNAIIDANGRVRVVDFGLAQLLESKAEQLPSTGERARPELTATGDVIGTLAYASPEQLAGRKVTAASDQFSFCVALHLAIEGVSPFTGFDLDERRASIERAPALATDGRRLPAWIRALIARGLAPDPSDRFPGMIDVVRELRRTRGWRRWRFPVLGVIALGSAIAATPWCPAPVRSHAMASRRSPVACGIRVRATVSVMRSMRSVRRMRSMCANGCSAQSHATRVNGGVRTRLRVAHTSAARPLRRCSIDR